MSDDLLEIDNLTVSFPTPRGRIDVVKGISFALGLFAAGHCLSSSWGDCGGAVACSGVLLKSTAMFFPPLNFVYVTWLVTQFA